MTIGGFVSHDPDLSAYKSTHLVEDFIDSTFYKHVMEEEAIPTKNRFRGLYD